MDVALWNTIEFVLLFDVFGPLSHSAIFVQSSVTTSDVLFVAARIAATTSSQKSLESALETASEILGHEAIDEWVCQTLHVWQGVEKELHNSGKNLF